MKNQLLFGLLLLGSALSAELPRQPLLRTLPTTDGVNGILASQDGKLYAASPTQGLVEAYDPSGIRIQSLVGPSDHRTPVMGGMDWDADGNLVVAQKDPCQIAVFDKSGKVVLQVGTKVDLQHSADPATCSSVDLPSDVAVGPDRLLYVADTGHHRVAVFNGSTGAFVRAWGSLGYNGGPYELSEPRGIAVVGERVYVADSGNARVMVYDRKGAFIMQIGRRGIGEDGFDSPYDVAVDGENRVWVADNGLQKVAVFGADGGFLKTYGGPFGELVFEDPISLAASPDGSILLGDGYSNRVFDFVTGVAISRSFEPKAPPAVPANLAAARIAFGPVPLQAGEPLVMSLPFNADAIDWEVLSLDMRRVGGGAERNASLAALNDTASLPSGVYIVRSKVRHGGGSRQEIQKIIVTR